MLVFAGVTAAQDARVAPLSSAELSIVAEVADEPTPEPEEHYPGSNEWRHDLYFDSVRDLGGVFVGVGTDQCYTIAAVQNASLVWVVDYDPLVARLHRMYAVLIRASATPAELVARFATTNMRATIELLERELQSDEARAEIVRSYRRNRPRLNQYLRHVAILRRDGRATSWLSDPILYARIRNLVLAGRIIARTGDVTGTTTLRAVGAATRSLRSNVRVVYFSNAEQFFRYTQSFGENVRSLPTDERTVVLRTFRHPRRVNYPEDDTWHYMVQPMADFLERLALGYWRNTHIVLDAIRGGLGREGVTIVGPQTPRDYSASARQ